MVAMCSREWGDRVLIDHNVRLDWPEDEPRWTKSLVSSLDRKHVSVSVLPLSVCAAEIVEWVNLASGEDAWQRGENRGSLAADLQQSIDALGPRASRYLHSASSRLGAALAKLNTAGRAVRAHPPGLRSGPEWVELLDAAEALLALVSSDGAVRATWSDLVEVARGSGAVRLEFFGMVDLLHAQLQLRHRDADRVLSDVVRLMAQDLWGLPFDDNEGQPLLPEKRLELAERVLLEPAMVEDIVVWLGYRGVRLTEPMGGGRISFMDAAWYIPNARPDGLDFPHKAELEHIVENSSLRYPELVDEEPTVELLVRVDLAKTTAAGARELATGIAEAVLDVSTHWSGGTRPYQTECYVLQNGHLTLQSWGGGPAKPLDDPVGRIMIGDAIERHASRLITALETNTLPIYLKAALEAQTSADQPYSREQLPARVTETEYRASIPLEDRVVQHIAAHATMTPKDFFAELIAWWPAARWEDDVYRATTMSLMSIGENHDRCDELKRLFYSSGPASPWLTFVADYAQELTALCMVESHRAWVGRVLASVNDATAYSELCNEYARGAQIIAERRKRARNALVHGNPIGTRVVESVTEISRFLSQAAMRVGLESFMTGQSMRMILDATSDKHKELAEGMSVADYWRQKAEAVPG